MISFNLITGFLGSGKTTFLKNILKELAPVKRVAVIQNEFAPSGIDGKVLKQNESDFKLVEINNGSVFCVCQLNNFVDNMIKLIDNYSPEVIFLEASGLADPISVVELLQNSTLKDSLTLGRSICLVDAPNYQKGLSSLVRFKHQLMVADQIIVNKIDLFEDDLNQIHNSIRSLNPFASIVDTTYASVKWIDFDEELYEVGVAAKQFIGKESEGRPEISACVLRTHDKISIHNLSLFLKDLQDTCPRIKGYLNVSEGNIVSVHSVFNQLEIKELSGYVGATELIAFGYGLSVVELRKKFKRFLLL